MPYPPVLTVNPGDDICLTARISCDTRTQIGLNEYYYRVQALSAPEPLFTVLDAWATAAAAVYAPCLTSDSSFIGATMIVYSGGIRFGSYFSSIAPTVGTASPGLLPTQVSGIITRRVDLKGPKGRGRIYIPFPGTVFLDSDEHATPAYLALLSTLASTLMPLTAPYMTLAGNSWDPGLWSASRPPNYSQMIDVRARRRWATQRRRGDYGTPNQNS